MFNEPNVMQALYLPLGDRRRIEMLTLWAAPKMAEMLRRCVHDGIIVNWGSVPVDDRTRSDLEVGYPLIPPETWERKVEFLIAMGKLAKAYSLETESWMPAVKQLVYASEKPIEASS